MPRRRGWARNRREGARRRVRGYPGAEAGAWTERGRRAEEAPPVRLMKHPMVSMRSEQAYTVFPISLRRDVSGNLTPGPLSRMERGSRCLHFQSLTPLSPSGEGPGVRLHDEALCRAKSQVRSESEGAYRTV